MRRIILTSITFLTFCTFLQPAHATPLTYHYKHYLFTITTSEQRDWKHPQEVWTYEGKPIMPPAKLRVDGDSVPNLPEGFARSQVWTFDSVRIAQTINDIVAGSVNRMPGSVEIRRASTGSIVFHGVGLPGRSVDVTSATNLSIEALESGLTDILLPVNETAPTVTVLDGTLTHQGITELVTVGESDFSRSPSNRRHNIAVGLSKFNGHLIPAGSIFSFDETLGRVDDTTGYLKELVIKGDQTIPDFGGGLCQVSTTAYRGVWEYGLPILTRKNHSYMVSHYSPQGTDATVYPPGADMRFKNTTSGALLMQTYAEGDNAYFLYYGTRDRRSAQIYGPFTWDRKPPPPEKTQPTLDLPPGEIKKVGEAVPGMHAAWFRVVQKDGKESVQGTYSIYEARPLFHLIGVASLPGGSGAVALPDAGDIN